MKHIKIICAIAAAALLTGCADEAVSSATTQTTAQTTTTAETTIQTTTAATTATTTTTTTTSATTTTVETLVDDESIEERVNEGETVESDTATDQTSEETESIESTDDAGETDVLDPYTDPIGYAKSMQSAGFKIYSIPYAPEGYEDILDWNLDNSIYRLCMTADTDAYTTDGIPLTTNGDLTEPVKPTENYKRPEGVQLEFIGDTSTALITELPDGCFWLPSDREPNRFVDPAGNVWLNTKSTFLSGNRGEGYYSSDGDYHPSQYEIDAAIAFNAEIHEINENGPSGDGTSNMTEAEADALWELLGG
ncbi:MAG: hypothetical protein IJZ47_12865 [Oscillospiraceae bacterium]|nr:hypothetical protein [Oscillospiraceae bacterium]